MFQQHNSNTPIFAYSSLWQILIGYIYSNFTQPDKVIMVLSVLTFFLIFFGLHQPSASSVVAYQFLGVETAPQFVQSHKVGFDSDNVIQPSLNNFKRRCMTGKYKRRRPDSLNTEDPFLVS